MMLIIFLGLMAKLALVSSNCLLGNHARDFNFNKVGVCVLTRLLKQAAVKTAACVLYFI
jgi:hypothetical protein